LTMSSLTTFSAYGLPDPEELEDWREWVKLTTTVVNGPSS
jgi:hypothetical protein